MTISNIIRNASCLAVLLAPACAVDLEAPPDVEAVALALNTQNCSGAQIDLIASAVDWAGLSLLNASKDLEDMRAGGSAERYSTWFGPRSDSREERVKRTLEGAYNTLGHVRFDCSCNVPPFFQTWLGVNPATTVAFVDPEDSSLTVQLCPLYFADAALGQDQFLEVGAGVLVHELTHFWGTSDTQVCVVPSCDDHPTVALQLDPEQASKNADNYMYYALGWPAGAASAVTCSQLNPQCPPPPRP